MVYLYNYYAVFTRLSKVNRNVFSVNQLGKVTPTSTFLSARSFPTIPRLSGKTRNTRANAELTSFSVSCSSFCCLMHHASSSSWGRFNQKKNQQPSFYRPLALEMLELVAGGVQGAAVGKQRYTPALFFCIFPGVCCWSLQRQEKILRDFSLSVFCFCDPRTELSQDWITAFTIRQQIPCNK